jgi:hypothetical protein
MVGENPKGEKLAYQLARPSNPFKQAINMGQKGPKERKKHKGGSSGIPTQMRLVTADPPGYYIPPFLRAGVLASL